MKYVWTPSICGLEAGIDGTTEIRDPETGEMLHSILRVQGRATAWPFNMTTGLRSTRKILEREGSNQPFQTLLLDRKDYQGRETSRYVTPTV